MIRPFLQRYKPTYIKTTLARALSYIIREERYFTQKRALYARRPQLRLHHCRNPLGVSTKARESNSTIKK